MKCKRLASFALSMLMVLNVVLAFPQKPVSAAAEEKSVFNAAKYMADFYSTEGKIPYKTIMHYCNDFTSPETELANQMNNSDNFIEGLIEWEMITFSPSQVPEIALDKIEYYETVIFKALKTYNESDAIEQCFDNEYTEKSEALFTAYSESMKLDFGYEFLDDLDPKDNAKVKNAMLDSFEKAFKETYPDLNKAVDGLEVFTDLIEIGEIGEKAINNVANYMACYHMNQGMKNVVYDLKEAYNGFTDPAFELALSNVADACQSSILAWNSAMLDTTTDGLQFVFKKVADIAFNAILSAEPFELGELIGRTIVESFVNIAFSTDEIHDQFYKLNCLKDFEALIQYVVQQEISDYQNNPNIENANTLLSAVEILFNTIDTSCDMADTYAEIVYRKGIVSILPGNKQKYEDFSGLVTDIKNTAKDKYTAEITKYTTEYTTDKNIEIIIPRIINGKAVTSIGESAFIGCQKIGCQKFTSITIPNNITNIGDYAFCECEYMNSIIIPNSVKRIGNGAFAECGLTSVTIPDSVTTVGDGAFGSCWFLTSINVSENNNAYSSKDGILFNKDKTALIQYPVGISKLTYNIPDSVTDIKPYAFECCTTLESVTIPNGVTSIGEMAFYGCESLTSIILPNTLTNIGFQTFTDCYGLKSIVIPDSVTNIEERAFVFSSVNYAVIKNPDCQIGDNIFSHHHQNIYYQLFMVMLILPHKLMQKTIIVNLLILKI